MATLTAPATLAGLASTDAIVVATNVVKHFSSGAQLVRAVDDVSLVLPRSRMIALRGPSGCGKSTLLNLIGALDKPTSGDVIVDGINVAKLSGGSEVQFRRRKVGFVFQQFNLVPYLTAVENVILPMEFSGMLKGKSDAQARAHELLRRVGLAPDRHLRRPSRLSGGEQQRVAIARALANDPPVIVGDEPTANLDQKTGRVIIELLHGLARDGRTVIIATHDNAIAAKADLVIDMLDGKLASDI